MYVYGVVVYDRDAGEVAERSIVKCETMAPIERRWEAALKAFNVEIGYRPCAHDAALAITPPKDKLVRRVQFDTAPDDTNLYTELWIVERAS